MMKNMIFCDYSSILDQMTPKRTRTGRLRTADQMRALASPVAMELIEAFQTGGAATVADLGPGMGRKATSLYYHIKKLVRVGLVRRVGSRRSGARTEAIYDVTAQVFSGSPTPNDPELRKLTNDTVASILRHTTRSYVRAAEQPGLVATGRNRNILVHRYKAWLTRSKLAEVNMHLEALDRIFAQNNGTKRGRLCALTTVLTPLSQDS